MASHRADRSPNQRYRFEQYFDYFSNCGFKCDLDAIISEKDDGILYAEGNFLGKAIIALKAFLKRLKTLEKAKKYDLVFISREAYLTGSTFFEKKLKANGSKIIYDFDDAIWLMDVSEANKYLKWLKRPSKTSELISLADCVIAGNNFLANYAANFNKNIIVIPSTIRTDKINNFKRSNEIPLVIGWSGSKTTIKHFEKIVPVLQRIKELYGEKVSFKVMGDAAYHNRELNIKGIPWSSEFENEVIASFDIGIMPLPDDDWSRGKCGLKGLSYMAHGIPSVLENVGMNREIIEDGNNGFLAKTDEEWFMKLSKLIDDAQLRKSLGDAAKITVENRFSFNSQKEVYVNCFLNVLSK